MIRLASNHPRYVFFTMSIISIFLLFESILLSVYYHHEETLYEIRNEKTSIIHFYNITSTSRLPAGAALSVTIDFNQSYTASNANVHFQTSSTTNGVTTSDTYSHSFNISDKTVSNHKFYDVVFPTMERTDIEVQIKFPPNSINSIKVKSTLKVQPPLTTVLIPFVALALAVYAIKAPFVSLCLVLFFVAFSPFTYKIQLTAFRILIGLVIYVTFNHLKHTLISQNPIVPYTPYIGMAFAAVYTIYGFFGFGKITQITDSAFEMLFLVAVAEVIGLLGYNDGRCNWTMLLDVYALLGLNITPLIGAFLKAYFSEYYGLSVAYNVCMNVTISGLFCLFLSDAYHNSEEASEDVVGVIKIETEFSDGKDDDDLKIVKMHNTSALAILCVPGIVCAILQFIAYFGCHMSFASATPV